MLAARETEQGIRTMRKGEVMKGRVAELKVKAWMEANGYPDVIHHPNGDKREDLLCKRPNENQFFYMEVERRNTWVRGPFPFSPANLQHRRYLKIRMDVLFITCRWDIKEGLVMFPQDILGSDSVVETNKVCNDETIHKVALIKCLPVNLTKRHGLSFAQLNLERIAALVRNADYATRRKVLGYRPPYGVPQEQWEEWVRPLGQKTPPKQNDKQGRLF